MAYSTPALVRLALVPSTDGGVSQPSPPSNTAADLTDDQLSDAISEADSTIDGYIGKYYAVPVLPIVDGGPGDGPVGAISHPIDYWSRSIAAYLATLAYREGLDIDDNDPVARRYNATIAQLIAVSKGAYSLQIPDNAGPQASTGAGPPINPYVGTMFEPDDFNLIPLPPGWPTWPDYYGHWGSNW